ncbi:MAG: 2-hydroxyacyl-CoA dehydratase [Thermodesulfobacteriota bacterium]|nr:2-hydroxyacyl-CoA dehydratase [Thermodesulfobacteriota bacterium]
MIGFTATIPMEIIFASDQRPVDLNNLFITSNEADKLVEQAEMEGFSHTTCSWIKGIYSTVLKHDIRKVITVTGGDCSNSIALGELFARNGIEVIPFEYPFNRDRKRLSEQIELLADSLSAAPSRIDEEKSRLDRIRAKLHTLDRHTYLHNRVSGEENHQFLVSSSDFWGDPDQFEKELDRFLLSIENREPKKEKVRLGYLGVPPILTGVYDLVESMGARVVFNEVQRQFSMPYHSESIVDQYLAYTYPYSIEQRISDIREAIVERELDGVIHYTQTFCYRQIYDIILRKTLSVPIFTMEGDRPGEIDDRESMRIETFINMLRRKKAVSR